MSVGLSDSRRGGRQLPEGGAVSSQNFETDSGSRHLVKRRRASEVYLAIPGGDVGRKQMASDPAEDSRSRGNSVTIT